ncbi:MAG: SCP2 sterol-binding domain-containing protein [[Eubacterium] siraeum]
MLKRHLQRSPPLRRPLLLLQKPALLLRRKLPLSPLRKKLRGCSAEPDKFALADMVREKFAKKDVSKVNEKIAIEIKAYGEKEFYIYILIDDGKVTVEPWGYIDNDVHIDMPIADVVAVVNGKYDFVAKAISGDFYAIGCVTKLLKAYEALIK